MGYLPQIRKAKEDQELWKVGKSRWIGGSGRDFRAGEGIPLEMGRMSREGKFAATGRRRHHPGRVHYPECRGSV